MGSKSSKENWTQRSGSWKISSRGSESSRTYSGVPAPSETALRVPPWPGTVLLDPNWLKPYLGVLSLNRTTLGASAAQKPAPRSGTAEETALKVPFIGLRISFLLFILFHRFRFWVGVFCFSWQRLQWQENRRICECEKLLTSPLPQVWRNIWAW